MQEGDPIYAERAQLWDSKIKDIHEWLVQIGIILPVGPDAPSQTVTYHEACHLCHGQKISSQPRDPARRARTTGRHGEISRQPRQVLGAIPNLKLVELAESTWCCGSAGIYNLIQPEMANELLARKVEHIRNTKADVVATANPGCLLQIISGVKRENLPVRVVHSITLLAEAYRRMAS